MRRVGASELANALTFARISCDDRAGWERMLRNWLRTCGLECREAVRQGLACLCRLELRLEACRALTHATLM